MQSNPEVHMQITQTTQKLGKFALMIIIGMMATACGSSILEPKSESYDEASECFMINGHWVCRP